MYKVDGVWFPDRKVYEGESLLHREQRIKQEEADCLRLNDRYINDDANRWHKQMRDTHCSSKTALFDEVTYEGRIVRQHIKRNIPRQCVVNTDEKQVVPEKPKVTFTERCRAQKLGITIKEYISHKDMWDDIIAHGWEDR